MKQKLSAGAKTSVFTQAGDEHKLLNPKVLGSEKLEKPHAMPTSTPTIFLREKPHVMPIPNPPTHISLTAFLEMSYKGAVFTGGMAKW